MIYLNLYYQPFQLLLSPYEGLILDGWKWRYQGRNHDIEFLNLQPSKMKPALFCFLVRLPPRSTPLPEIIE